MPQLDFEGLGVKITALVQMQRATAIAAIVWMASAAHGAEVNLDGISDDDLAGKMRGGSLLVEQTLLEENPPTSAEILAAAQADYKRLLAVLYDNGYFSGVIKIKTVSLRSKNLSVIQKLEMLLR